MAIDAAGNALGTLDEWNGKSMRDIAGMAVDRAGCVAYGMGQRGEILRVPIHEVIKTQ